MAWNFCKGKPIYRQITDRIAIDVLTGAILPTQRMPSVEDMSRITGASVHVVAKAYDDLIACGIAEKHGKLCIISDDKTQAQVRRNQIARIATESYIADMKELGYGNKELLKLFGESLVKITRDEEKKNAPLPKLEGEESDEDMPQDTEE